MRMREKLQNIERRELLLLVIPALLVVLFAFWFAWRYVEPAPPRTIAITTGSAGGAYHTFAERYRTILARDGITLELKPSAGALENLARLKDDNAGVSAGLMQAGVARAADAPQLLSLGRLFHEPLWIFYRSNAALDRVGQLKGLRIAIGPEGSGTRSLSLLLLRAGGIDEASAKFVEAGGKAAVQALLEGRVDAAFLVASQEAETVRTLLDAPNVRLMSLAQAEAYARRFPFLNRIVLPQGVIDLARNVPAADVALVATSANLLVRDDLHPAIITLLARAAAEVHGGPGVFNAAGAFPVAADAEFPVSADAQRFYRQGAPFLMRYLPFWLAVLIERLVVMLIPIVTILVPVIKFAPAIYNWRIRSRIIRWYSDLRVLEDNLRDKLGHDEVAADLAELDRIERDINDSPLPSSFTDQYYHLRSHIELVRGQLNVLQGRHGTKPPQDTQGATRASGAGAA